MQSCMLLFVLLISCNAFMRAAELPCGLNSIQETTPLLYPPIAKAAHINGPVIMIAQFSLNGSVHSVDILSGPEMLRKSAKDFVQGWTANPYGGSRACPIVVAYELDTQEKNGNVERKGLQHYVVTGYTPCLCDPAVEVGKKHKRFGIF